MELKMRETGWVDAAKAIAMLAVIVNHTYGNLYQSDEIALLSIFSVSTFVFLSGITSYCSVEKHRKEPVIQEWFRRLKNILLPYAAATLLYAIALHRFFDLREYLMHLIKFDASSPFYFVVFYIQLILVAPVLYHAIQFANRRKRSYLWHLLFFVVLVIVSVLSIKFTFILDVWGGGKFLFGGTYLILFYLGMLFANANVKFVKISHKTISLLLSVVAVVAWWLLVREKHFEIDAFFPFGEGINPPSISFMVYSLLVIWLLFSLFSLMKDCSGTVIKKIYECISVVGKYSLYIFLYHRLVKDYLLTKLPYPNIWIKIIVFFAVMIYGPMLGKIVYDFGKKKIKTIIGQE